MKTVIFLPQFSSGISDLMEMETSTSLEFRRKNDHLCRCTLTKLLPFLLILLSLLIIFHFQASPAFSYPYSASSLLCPSSNLTNTTHSSDSKLVETLTARLRDSVNFLPLKDLKYSNTPTSGNTWFMSSLADTIEKNEPKYLYFPSNSSKGQILCIKGQHRRDGTKNSYALARPEALPPSATLLEGLTFISETYYSLENLWHGLCAIVPFVGWSMKNQGAKPSRWVLFHWGELRIKMGLWVWNLARAQFGDVGIEVFAKGDVCFEKAVVMRHEMGGMGDEKKLRVFDMMRYKAREACGLDPMGRGRELNERGAPIIRFTLLMRKGPRSFKNEKVVKSIFMKECEMVDGCVLSVIQSENLSFCDQVRVMTNTDIVASPHGAQLTNMLFMDRGSSVMEFFPKGWLEHAGKGQYVQHWLARQSGMKHEGGWWDPIGKECPNPKEERQCMTFYKDGKVGHNETHFAEWARKVLNQVRVARLKM